MAHSSGGSRRLQELREVGRSRGDEAARRSPFSAPLAQPRRDNAAASNQTLAQSGAQSGWTYADSVICVIACGLLLRFLCAAFVPLAGDEVLYWRYSRHLAAGYLDHPLMNPLLIRAGTS